MKTIAKKFTGKLAASDAIWPFLEKYLINVAKHALHERAKCIFDRHFPDSRVYAGPFKGLNLPETVHPRGSSFIPKIIGSYEAELYPVIETIIEMNPPVFVDVGCAEGYYAVGLAIRCSSTQVIAFDLNEHARTACEETAKANHVEERVRIESACIPKTLIELNLPDGSVVMSDCEGYEIELFTPEVVTALRACAVFIEVHDLYNPVISETLKQRFAASHHLQVIRSSHDKSDLATHPSLRHLSPAMFRDLTYERDFNMDWFLFQPFA